MATYTPPRRINTVPNQGRSTATRSLSPTPMRKLNGSPCLNVPVDGTARFSLSHLPGLAGYDIETGNTLEEARLKVVTLSCEVERLQNYNYTLVRENEILRANNNKTAREQDLEMKLAIVIAENEKLNQVIEEIYEAFMAQGQNVGDQQQYEIRIAQLMKELEDSRSQNISLQQNNRVELQNTVNQLTLQVQLLTNQLTNKDKELEVFRRRTASLEILLRENERLNDLMADHLVKVENLKRENAQLNATIQALKAQPNKVVEVERITQSPETVALLRKVQDENNSLKQQLAQALRDNSQLSVSLKTSQLNASRVVEVERNSPELIARLQKAQDENNQLRQQLGQATRDNSQLTVSLQTAQLNADRSSQAEQAKHAASNDFANQLKQAVEENTQLKQQIAQLTNKNNQLSQSLQVVQGNLDRLGEVDKAKQAANSNTLNRLQELQSENDQLRTQIQTQKIQVMKVLEESKITIVGLQEKDRENNATIAKLNANIKTLLEENEKLNAILANHSQINFKLTALEEENRKLKSALEQSDKQNFELDAKLRQALAEAQRIDELKNKMILVVTENERLNNIIAAKTQEIDALMTKLHGVEERLADIDLLVEKIQLMSIDNERLQAKLSELDAKARELMLEKSKYESEITALKDALAATRAENQEWRVKYAELEASKDHEEELEILRKDFEDIKAWALRAREEQQRFGAERMAYETQILQLQQRNDDLEAYLLILEGEKKNLAKLHDEKITTIEQLRRDNNKEAQKLEILELQSQLDNVKSVAYDVKQMLLQAQNEKETTQRRVNDLLQENENLNTDVNQLKQLIELRRADAQSLAKQNEELRKLCDNLSKQKRESAYDSADSLEPLKLKISELENSRNEYKRQAERNANDLTRKNRELVEKIQELDFVKLKYDEALANYQALNNRMFTRMSEKRY